MPVLTVNNIEPDEYGNINIPHGPEGPQGDQGIQGPQGFQGPRGPKGEIGVIYVNDSTKQLKMYQATATVTGNEGTFILDISTVGFSTVLHVSPMLMSGSFSQANAPLAVNFNAPTSTNISGKAFKATSAGLLAAMQQTPADPGTEINLMIIGY